MLDAQPFVDVPDLDADEQCRLEATTHGNPVESLLQGLPDLQLGYDLSTFAFRSLSCFYCQDWSWFGRLVCIFLVDIQVIGEERPPSTSRLLLKIWGFCVKRLPLSLGSPLSLPSYLPPSLPRRGQSFRVSYRGAAWVRYAAGYGLGLGFSWGTLRARGGNAKISPNR